MGRILPTVKIAHNFSCLYSKRVAETCTELLCFLPLTAGEVNGVKMYHSFSSTSENLGLILSRQPFWAPGDVLIAFAKL